MDVKRVLRGQQQVHAFPQSVGGWSLETESQRGPEFEEKSHLFMKLFTLHWIVVLLILEKSVLKFTHVMCYTD